MKCWGLASGSPATSRRVACCSAIAVKLVTAARTRLGPDLAGVTKRLSRDDLLSAIVNPSRDVAPAYRTNNIDLKDGKRLTGIVVFESADGLLVQTGATETKRIAAADIESRTPSLKSLMPDGLLRGLRPKDIADLFAFLEKQ